MSLNQSNGIEIQNTNSAERLFKFLIDMRANTSPQSLMEVLPAVLDVPLMGDNQNWVAMQSLAIVSNMIADVEREIAQSPLSSDAKVFHLQFIPGICAAFSPPLFGTAWSQLRPKLTELDLNRVESVDMALRPFVHEKVIGNDELADFVNLIDGAIETLAKANCPRELKDLITHRLIGLKIAIAQYKYRGMIGLEYALAAYCGTLLLVDRDIPKTKKRSVKALFDKLKEVAARGEAIVKIGRGFAWVWHHGAELKAAVVDPLLLHMPHS